MMSETPEYVKTEQYQELNRRITELGNRLGFGTPEYESKIQELLRESVANESFSIVEEKPDELVVESTCFRGHHNGSLDRHGDVIYSELGQYVLKGTGEECEWVGDHGLIRDAEQRQHRQQCSANSRRSHEHAPPYSRRTQPGVSRHLEQWFTNNTE